MTRRLPFSPSMALVSFLLASPTAAAAGWPDWATVAQSGFSLQRFAEDDAVVLLDEREITLSGGHRKGTHRRVIHILTEEGVKAATLRILRNNFAEFSKIKVWVKDPRSRVFYFSEDDGAILANLNRQLLDDSELLLIAPPGLGAGSTVAIQYQFQFSPDIPQDLFLIQDSVPVVRSIVTLDAHNGWQTQARTVGYATPGPETVVEEGKWEFKDIPASPAPEMELDPIPERILLALDYLPPGQLGPFRDWGSTARWILGLFPSGTDDVPTIEEALSALRRTGNDLIEETGKMARDLRYFALEIGWGAFTPRPPQTTLRRGLGDCKDKAFLMVTLLRRLGVEAVPVLVAAPSHRFVPENIPSLLSFDHCIVGIVWRGRERSPRMVIVESPGLGPLRLFDATLASGSPLEIPFELEGGVGLALHQATTGLLRIPAGKAEENIQQTLWRCEMAADGGLLLQRERRYFGTLRARLQGSDGEPEDVEELRSQAFELMAGLCPGVQRLAVDPVHIEEGGTWSHGFSCLCPNGLADIGGDKVFSLPHVASSELFPRVASAKEGSVRTMVPRTIFDVLTFEGKNLPQLNMDEKFEQSNELGKVEMSVTRKEMQLVVTRTVTLREKKITRDHTDRLEQLRGSLRKINGLVFIWPAETAASVEPTSVLPGTR